VVSVLGYEAKQDKVAMAALARKRGGKMLLFAGPWLSPVTSGANVVLPC
jgi:DNA-binding MurR/RpiR family transcriptional regulator